jgi:hypothetical protein
MSRGRETYRLCCEECSSIRGWAGFKIAALTKRGREVKGGNKEEVRDGEGMRGGGGWGGGGQERETKL